MWENKVNQELQSRFTATRPVPNGPPSIEFGLERREARQEHREELLKRTFGFNISLPKPPITDDPKLTPEQLKELNEKIAKLRGIDVNDILPPDYAGETSRKERTARRTRHI